MKQGSDTEHLILLSDNQSVEKDYKCGKFLSCLQHCLNELHIYCHLRNLKFPRRLSIALAKRLSPRKFIYNEDKTKNNY